MTFCECDRLCLIGCHTHTSGDHVALLCDKNSSDIHACFQTASHGSSRVARLLLTV